MRSEKELRDNLAAYWRRLNAACGLPDGTHPDDPNPAGMDHPLQPKHSQSRMANAPGPMPSFKRIHDALLADPEAMAIFQDHWNDTFMPNDLGPAPANPEAQLRWYTLRDLNEHHHKRHKADFEDARKFRTRRRVDRLLERLAVIDPLFKGTMRVLRHHIEQLPFSGRESVESMFARCPHETLRFYGELHGAARKSAEIYRHRQAKGRG